MNGLRHNDNSSVGLSPDVTAVSGQDDDVVVAHSDPPGGGPLGSEASQSAGTHHTGERRAGQLEDGGVDEFLHLQTCGAGGVGNGYLKISGTLADRRVVGDDGAVNRPKPPRALVGDYLGVLMFVVRSVPALILSRWVERRKPSLDNELLRRRRLRTAKRAEGEAK